MKCMTYLINWEKVQDKVLDLEKDFIENEISHVIVNSSYDEKEHWMNIGGDSWATRQLYEIYKDAYLNNYDYIFLLYGDVSVNELPMSKVISNSIDYLKNNYGCGIYTTSFTYNHWGSPHTIIKNNENNVHNICATDFSFVGISREVYSFIFNFMDNFSVDNNIDEYHSAWGFDILCWIYCIYNNIDLLRDCNINLIHDISTTGYNDAIAREQMHHTVDSGINYMVNNLGLKESSIRTIRDMFNTQYHSRTFEYKDFYQWGAK